VGFEFYFRHHLSQDSLYLIDKSANTRPGNHIETYSELCSCGQTVGKRIFSCDPLLNFDCPVIISESRENGTRNAPPPPVLRYLRSRATIRKESASSQRRFKIQLSRMSVSFIRNP
jgi:hypothetical protein